MTTFRLACVQLTAGNDMTANIAAAERLVRDAAREADFIALPECALMLEPNRRLAIEKAAPEASHPGLAAFRALAQDTGRWLLVGSLTIRLDGDQLANRSFLIDKAGGVVARYDKIHMFDVQLPGGESYRESATYRPGTAAQVVPTPFGRLGMTVCYDVRFPQLYRALGHAGAELLSVPSAFTVPTGRAHWHVLLRARAIETGAYVFAPAQCGEHAGGRLTYGHSLIVDPWGAVIAEAGEQPGVITAEIDLAKVTEARRAVPSLSHDRPFAPPVAGKAAAE
jgi:predicted amidohydrolase